MNKYFSLIDYLVVHDGPQVIIGNIKSNRQAVGVAVDDVDGMESPFWVVPVDKDLLSQYFSESIDLRYLLIRTKSKSSYLMDLSNTQSSSRFPLKVASEVQDDWIPDSGFFSRFHTSSYGRPVANLSSRTLPVDGRWDFSDLKEMPKRLIQVYGFLWALSADADEKIRALFTRYPWKGGLSSVNFYDDLYHRAPRSERLIVQKFEYASPGEIVVRADEDVLGNVFKLIQAISSNYEDARESYKNLNSYLSEAGFLGVSLNQIQPADYQIAEVKRLALDLADEIAFAGMDKVLSLCDQNWIGAAKILLSFYRRSVQLSEFFETGKISIG